MNKKLVIPRNIICVDEQDRILSGTAVEIVDGKISNFFDLSKINIKSYQGEVFDYSNYTLLPGFVQTHVHLCQTLFRGLADDLPLLEWLKSKIFPFENAHNEESLKISVKLGINELLLGGTTSILDMGTLRHQEIVFIELLSSGLRAISGKCMIDENDLYPEFKSTTKKELENTYKLAGDFHNKDTGRVKYGFAPRFVLSCTEKLLRDTKEMMKDFEGSMYHTHSSENMNEISEVRNRFGKENIEYFDSLKLLDTNTLLAHCVHTDDKEKGILKNTGTRVAHCPSANLKLGSGTAPIPEYLKEGISVSLGADGAPCNNSLSIFNEMKLAGFIQKPVHGADVLSAETLFRMATIGGAEALHLQDETGSIEKGKKADLVLIDLQSPKHTLSDDPDNMYSDIVYSSSSHDVKCVMVDGEWLVKDGMSMIYDQDELIATGRKELKQLLKRVN